MTRIDVDFNNRTGDGLVKISRRRADGDIAVGDVVELYDGADPSMNFLGRIRDLDDDGRGLALMEWADELPPAWPAHLWELPDPKVDSRPAVQNDIDTTTGWISITVGPTVLEPSR
jgi:hypothetical protein